MKMTGKDKRMLRGLGNRIKPSVYVGKDGLTDAVFSALDEAHRGSELIKLRVLDTCAQDRKEVAAALQAESDSEVVQLLGRTILLFRRDAEDPQLRLPSEKG